MAKLERIRTGSTGSLTPLEREALSILVKEYNSDFRVQASTVPFVGDILPEAGAIVVSDHDGRMYRADQHGWNLMGVDSPIMLFVDYTDTQFAFKFKLPSTSTLNIYDGDGTVTAVAGQDDVEVTHTTDYSEAGTYTFYVEGDYDDITELELSGQRMITGGNISRIYEISSLTSFGASSTGVTGSISNYGANTNLIAIALKDTAVTGSLNTFIDVVNMRYYNFTNTIVVGDLSEVFVNMVALESCYFRYCDDVTFESIITMPSTITYFYLYDIELPSAQVDNALISLANGGVTGAVIRLGGTNAARTSASDAAMSTLLENGNTVTVNYDSPVELTVDYTDTQFNFRFKLPSTSYVEIHDGDGTSTIIQGQDDTLITHTTTYSEPGTYTFYVEGDVTELTTINIAYQEIVSGDISGWSALVNATLIRFLGTLVTGDISGFANIPTLLNIAGTDSNVHGDVSGYAALPTDLIIVLTNTDVSGDISGLVALTGSNNMQFSNSNVTGDISGFHVMSNLSFLWFDGCDVSFSEVNDWSFDVGYGDEIKLENCGFTSTEVDNVLLSFAGGTNSNFTMTLGGTNASRTSASDAALATLEGRGWAITVNE